MLDKLRRRVERAAFFAKVVRATKVLSPVRPTRFAHFVKSARQTPVGPHLAVMFHAAAHPDKEALVFPDERVTYRELADRAWSVGESLVALGVQPGEHVGVLMTNHPDLLASVFGASLVGAVVVPINARYRTNELRFLIEELKPASPRAVADEADLAAHLEELAERLRRRGGLAVDLDLSGIGEGVA